MTTPKMNPARERHWICAKRVRERRLTLRLTQREVVSRLQSRGNQTSNRALSAMENGRGLDLGLLPELAESLACTVTYLLGLTDDPTEWQPRRPAPRPDAMHAEPNEWTLGALRPAVGVLGPELPHPSGSWEDTH